MAELENLSEKEVAKIEAAVTRLKYAIMADREIEQRKDARKQSLKAGEAHDLDLLKLLTGDDSE